MAYETTKTTSNTINSDMKLLKELTTFEPDTDTINLCEAINESLKTLKLASKGKRIVPKDAKDFFKKDSRLAIAVAASAVDAYSKLKVDINKSTLSLFAGDVYERRLVKDVVDLLTKSGKYKVRRMRYASNGQFWDMIRTQVL